MPSCDGVIWPSAICGPENFSDEYLYQAKLKCNVNDNII